MKRLLPLLAAALCLPLPAALRAEPPAAKKKARPTQTAEALQASRVARAEKPGSHQTIYYITSRPLTGSHIPMVYRRYNGGRMDAAGNPAVYGQDAINATGLDDVGAALYRLDSSFTTTRR